MFGWSYMLIKTQNNFSYALYKCLDLVHCPFRIFIIKRWNIDFLDNFKHPSLFVASKLDLPILSLPQIPNYLKVLADFVPMLGLITASNLCASKKVLSSENFLGWFALWLLSLGDLFFVDEINLLSLLFSEENKVFFVLRCWVAAFL